jgi:hypothetical protein
MTEPVAAVLHDIVIIMDATNYREKFAIFLHLIISCVVFNCCVDTATSILITHIHENHFCSYIVNNGNNIMSAS